MAVFQIGNGACTGRGFADTSFANDGYLAKFYDWITSPPASGGPGWTILYDRSTLPTWKTMTNITSGTITCSGHGFVTNDKIYYNVSGNVMAGLSNSTHYFTTKIDNDRFKLSTYRANVGLQIYVNITSSGTGTQQFIGSGPYIVVSNIPSPQTNQVGKYLKIGYHIYTGSYIDVQSFLGWDNTNKCACAFWAGYQIQTVDDGSFAYDFRGGDECMILQSRIGTSWDSTGIDTWTGDATFVEGLDHSGTLVSATVAGSNVTLPLRTGDENNITSGEFYYMYDFSLNPRYRVEYTKCTSVDTVNHTVNISGSVYPWPSGSVIGSYPHRYTAWGTNGVGYPDFCGRGGENVIPYYSHPLYNWCFSGSNINYSLCTVSQEYGMLSISAPNDKNKYAMEKFNILELNHAGCDSYYYTSNNSNMNRAYGSCNNIYVTTIRSMSRGQDGLTYGGKNYLYFINHDEMSQGTSAYAILYPDSTSLT